MNLAEQTIMRGSVSPSFVKQICKCCKYGAADNPGISFGDLAKLLGARFKELTEEELVPYRVRVNEMHKTCCAFMCENKS